MAVNTPKPTEKPVSLQTLYAPVMPALEKVKTCLLDIVPPESQLLAETLQHSLGGGGKYLRPVVTLLSGAATGEITDKLIETAAVAEMIHIATLLHDDVLDESELRRGRKTVRAQWGNTVSVLSGDYLLAQASLKLAHVGVIRLVAIYSKVLADLCDGEVEQIRTSYRIDDSGQKPLPQTPSQENSPPENPQWNSYYQKSLCKTASLFAAGCESAGVLNQLPEAQIQLLRAFGENFGIAFQIVDDLLDYTSSEAELGKPVLDDLRNGLLNAPILLALESDRLNATEHEAFRKDIRLIFDEPTGDNTEAAIAGVRQALEKADALEKTRQLAQNYAERAIASLDFVVDGPEKQTLRQLVEISIYRRN